MRDEFPTNLEESFLEFYYQSDAGQPIGTAEIFLEQVTISPEITEVRCWRHPSRPELVHQLQA
jgi:hypothetical protein